MNKHFTADYEQSKAVFEGYASIFNIVDKNNDVILPGTFKDTIINDSDIKLLWQHEYKSPIGKILSIYEDTKGLYLKGELLLNLTKGKEAYNLVSENVIYHLSIGYEVKDCYYYDNIRYITEVLLWEISIVTFASNSECKITMIYDQECKALDIQIHKAIGLLT